MDLVGTCPKDFWWEWIAEGDPAGTEESGTEWGWYTGHFRARLIRPGDRFYVVCHGLLRGYAPVTSLRDNTSRGGGFVICRRGNAVAVTIDEPIPGFRGLRERWWPYEAERPFPDWKTAAVPGLDGRTDESLRVAFDTHISGQSKFTRSMAVLASDEVGMAPMFFVWRLEQMGLVRPGSWEWFKENGGITKRHISEARRAAGQLAFVGLPSPSCKCGYVGQPDTFQHPAEETIQLVVCPRCGADMSSVKCASERQ